MASRASSPETFSYARIRVIPQKKQDSLASHGTRYERNEISHWKTFAERIKQGFPRGWNRAYSRELLLPLTERSFLSFSLSLHFSSNEIN